MLALLIPLALLQQPLTETDTGKRVQIGLRLELTLKSGSTVRGIVIRPYGAPADYSPAYNRNVFLDITLEHARMSGTVSIERQNITRVRILRPLSSKEIGRILSAKKLAADKLSQEDQDRMTAQDTAYQKWQTERLEGLAGGEEAPGVPKGKSPAELEEEKAALAIYEEFPEAKGWSEKRYADMKDFMIPTYIDDPKYMDARKPIPGAAPGSTTFAPADKDEARFFDNYPLWLKGKQIAAERRAAEEAADEEIRPQPDKLPPEEKRKKEEAPPRAVETPEFAYMDYRSAIKGGEIQGILKRLAKNNRQELLNDPDAEAKLELMAAMMPTQVKVVDKREETDRATLLLVGLLGENEVRGNVLLIKEDGQWRLSKESWK